MTYISNFCKVGTHACRKHYAAYGKTEAKTCECACHRLAALVEQIGVVQSVEILEVFADDAD